MNETTEKTKGNPEKWIEEVKSEEVFAYMDASMKDKYMGAHYCFVNDANAKKIEKSTCSDQWKGNAAHSAEAQILLEAINKIEEEIK